MKIKELRESVGLRQKDLVEELRSEGINVTTSDLSRIENGAIETYLFLAFRAEEIINRKKPRQNAENATQGKKTACKWLSDLIYKRITERGQTNYPEMAIYSGETDYRVIRRGVEAARKEYPLIDLDGGGWGLATTIAECNKQLQIYEKKKRVYSYQETPLIAKKYELERELYGADNTEFLRSNPGDGTV